MDARPQPIRYVCGECGAESVIKEGAVVQCSDNSCGFRVLYKKRTRQVVEFQAR